MYRDTHRTTLHVIPIYKLCPAIAHSHMRQSQHKIWRSNSPKLGPCPNLLRHYPTPRYLARIRAANGRKGADLPQLRRGIRESGIPGNAAQGSKGEVRREGQTGTGPRGAALPCRQGEAARRKARATRAERRPALIAMAGRLGSDRGTDWTRKGRARAGFRGAGTSGGGQYTRYWHLLVAPPFGH